MEEESKNCRSWEEDTYWKHFHSVLFCQILPTNFQHRLILPEKFTENMKGDLPEKVALKGPNEVTWSVNLVKGSDGGAMFHGDGWKEFVKAYSLKKADILVCKYNRSECFEVLLVDGINLCEKEASYFVRKCRKPQSSGDCIGKETEKGDDDSNYPPSNKRRKQGRTRKNHSSDRATHTRDRFHRDQLDKPQTLDEEDSSSEQQDSLEVINGTPRDVVHARHWEVPSISNRKRGCNFVSAKKTLAKRKGGYDVNYISNRRPVTEAEKEKTLRMAQEKASKCENSFIVIMRPTSVYRRFFMSIPTHWKLKRNFQNKQEMLLRVEEKAWVCKFCVMGNCGLQGGWEKFARDNLLEEFDVCVFAPAGHRDGMFVLEVSIFRVVSEVVLPTLA